MVMLFSNKVSSLGVASGLKLAGSNKSKLGNTQSGGMMVGDESTTGAATVCSTITVGCVSSISRSSLASISSNTGGEKAKS